MNILRSRGKISKRKTPFGLSTAKMWLACWLLLVVSLLRGQSFSSNELRETFRNEQLLKTDRPVLSSLINANQIKLHWFDSAMGKPVSEKNSYFRGGFLPVSVLQQYNTQLPNDWNDESMIPAKGYQARISAGVFLQAGKHLTLQLAPEFVYAGNPSMETFSQQLGDGIWARYYDYLNSSDMPERFGNTRYQKVFAGQSSIKYTANNIAFGLSTENLWWGPGWRNSLVMSNNAPGFLHVTFNTVRPVNTGIGSFEWQVIGGWLNNSGILPPRIYSTFNGNFLYHPKSENQRYLTGMVLTWKPKWVKNIFLGIAKSSYLYSSDIGSILDVLPLQGFVGKRKTEIEKNGKKASMGSLFAKYVMPDDMAEIYVEYGRKDLALMPWNIIQSEPYRRAYILGMRKMFKLRDPQAHMQVGVEMADLSSPTAALNQSLDGWYTDRIVQQGYTQMGQTIGAGIGPGSSSQTLAVNWIKGLKTIGIEFERVKHNEDFYYYAFTSLGDYRRHWIDLSTTLKYNWNFKKLMVSGRVFASRSYNYDWLVIQIDPTNYFPPSNDFLNFGARIELRYTL